MNLPLIKDKREPYHALAWVFIYFAFFVGGTFLYMAATEDTTGITLYTVMHEALGYPGNFIWSGLLILGGCGTLLFYYLRKPWIATISASLGALIWLFLGWLYLSEGYYDGILAAVVPNLWFWSWYWFKAGRYKRTVKDAHDLIGDCPRVTSVRTRSRRIRRRHIPRIR